MTIIVCTAGGVFLLWAAWWIYRGTPKHRTTVAPTVAAHHSLRKDFRAPRIAPPKLPTRHTHRDPTTGRYTRKEQ